MGVLALPIAACTPEPQVVEMYIMANNADESEVFFGSAVGKPNDSGIFRMNSREGTLCEGVYMMSSTSTGNAVIQCSDGRSGSFEFSSNGRVATGVGQIAGEPFSAGVVDRQLIDDAAGEMQR